MLLCYVLLYVVVITQCKCKAGNQPFSNSHNLLAENLSVEILKFFRNKYFLTMIGNSHNRPKGLINQVLVILKTDEHIWTPATRLD